MEQFDFIEDAELKTKVVEVATSLVTEGVDNATSGLKSKNSELLDEKKKLKEQFDGLTNKIGDKSIDDLIEAHKLVNSEEGKLLKEGKKLEELVEIRTSSLKKDMQTKLEEAQTLAADNSKNAIAWENRFKTKVVEDTLREAAVQAKVRPEAYEDVVMRGRSYFKMSDDGEVEARDSKGNLLKVGDLIATPKNWVESLKNSHPHYWPLSEGGDLGGAGGGGGQDLDSQILAAAKRGDVNEVRRLTKKKREDK